MQNTAKTTIARLALAPLVLGLAATAAMAQTYTLKVGGASIDPRATSGAVQGTIPIHSPLTGSYLGNASTNDGVFFEVQRKSTLIFSIERAFDTNWSAELVLGVPPTHDVKLRSSTPSVTAPGPLAAAVPLVKQHLQAADGEVVAKVREIAPTAFINYKFLDASSAFRPYVGVGINYTNFKVTSTDLGNAIYSDGPVRISSTDSIGLAFHIGADYKFDKHWLLNASWSTAGVKNNITIRTDHSEQTASYRFHPSVFSVMVGYQF
ncbi:MAG: OmpW family outer membrane protein [Aquabacterium sp.]